MYFGYAPFAEPLNLEVSDRHIVLSVQVNYILYSGDA